MNDAPKTESQQRAPRRINPAFATMWATAFILGGMILMQAGRVPSNSAHAGTANGHDDFSVLTARSGSGDLSSPNDLLYVIDGRDEVLLVYEVEDARKGGITLRDGGSLEVLFRSSRR